MYDKKGTVLLQETVPFSSYFSTKYEKTNILIEGLSKAAIMENGNQSISEGIPAAKRISTKITERKATKMQDQFYHEKQDHCNEGIDGQKKGFFERVKGILPFSKKTVGKDTTLEESDTNQSVQESDKNSEEGKDREPMPLNGSAIHGESTEGSDEGDRNGIGTEGSAGVDRNGMGTEGSAEGDCNTEGSVGGDHNGVGTEGSAEGGHHAAPGARSMQPVSRCIKNYNEKGDLTKEKIREIIEEGNFFGRFTEIEQALGVDLIALLESITDLRDQGKVYFRGSEIMLTDILGECMFIHTGRQTDELMNNSVIIENVGQLCGFEGLERLPDRATRENFYKNVNPEEFRPIMYQIVHKLIESNRYLGNRFVLTKDGKERQAYPLVLDATQIAYFNKRHCPLCYRQKIKEDKEGNPVYGYSHKILVAKIALSDRLFITLDWEPIEGVTEEKSKQDCENEAAKKLLARIREYFRRTCFLLQGDALYATAPILALVTQIDIDFLVSVKEGSQKLIYKEARRAIEAGEADQKIWNCQGEEGIIYWVNDIAEKAGKELSFPVNFLMVVIEKEVKADGTVTTVRATKHPDGWKHYTGKELSSNPENFILAEPDTSEVKESSEDKEKPVQEAASKEVSDAVKKVMEQTVNPQTGTVFSGEMTQEHGCEVYVQERIEDDGTTTIMVKLVFSWLASYKIDKENASRSVKRGRKRWSVETDFNMQKNILFDIQHMKGYDPNSMKVHFCLTQIASLLIQMFFAYDKPANTCGLSYTTIMKLIYISCRTQRLAEYDIDFSKPIRLYEQKKRAS